jgi:RimJ/RimL family protein N-acetyltransferase
MTKKTQSLDLRPWQEGDEGALVKIANNRKIWRNLTERFPHPYTMKDAVSWIEHANSEPSDAINLALLANGQIAGGAGFERRGDLSTRTAEMGYWLGEPYWGKGFATRALVHTTQKAFEDFDFVRLEAGVIEWNPASKRVLEKAGYTFEARHAKRLFKDGQHCDEFIYALLREDWNPSSA